jgi:hypothetical protein
MTRGTAIRVLVTVVAGLLAKAPLKGQRYSLLTIGDSLMEYGSSRTDQFRNLDNLIIKFIDDVEEAGLQE